MTHDDTALNADYIVLLSIEPSFDDCDVFELNAILTHVQVIVAQGAKDYCIVVKASLVAFLMSEDLYWNPIDVRINEK
jgi:hypothetical protein